MVLFRFIFLSRNFEFSQITGNFLVFIIINLYRFSALTWSLVLQWFPFLILLSVLRSHVYFMRIVKHRSQVICLPENMWAIVKLINTNTHGYIEIDAKVNTMYLMSASSVIKQRDLSTILPMRKVIIFRF